VELMEGRATKKISKKEKALLFVTAKGTSQ
jgi:hypothetical protein